VTRLDGTDISPVLDGAEGDVALGGWHWGDLAGWVEDTEVDEPCGGVELVAG